MLVRRADFAADHAAIRAVRFGVFVNEQRVPEDLELDDRDVHCVHVLALDDDGRPIGTGRIDVDGKVGRVAVAANARRTGVGRALMDALHDVARERGLSLVWCNAQVTAVPFYERLGYRTVSERFVEAGIDHVRMQKRL